MKVLIVDDNKDDRRLLRYIIEGKGHEAVEAEDGLDGLRMAKIHGPDLIISDALMPVMDGFQFLRMAKKDETVRAIPFIFYSAAYRGDRDVDLAIAEGADAFIIKPKDPKELWDEVEIILKEGANERIITPELIEEDEEYLRRYSQVVAEKLEEKVRELEKVIESQEKGEKEIAYLASIVRSVPEAVCAIDPAGNVIFWNEAAVKIYGYGQEEIIGKPMAMIMPEDIAQLELEHYVGVLNREGEFTWLESVRLTKDGRNIPVEVSVFAMRDGSGNITSYTSITRDITERKMNENRLVQAKEEWERTFDAIEDPIMILDADYRIINANRTMAEKLGVTKSEAEGLVCFECVHGTKEPPESCPHKKLMSDGRYHSVEVYEERLGGFCNVTVSPLHGPDGKVYASVHIARDITEQKISEQRISRLNRVYSMLSKINETIVRVRDRDRLFEEVCRISVEHGLFRMACIGTVGPGDLTAKPAAFYGHEEGYFDIVRLSAKGEMPQGICSSATAARTGTHCICNNIKNDETVQLWRDEAIKRGYRSFASFPLKAGESVIGVVNFYSGDTDFFDEEEVGLLEEVAVDISFALEFLEKEEKRMQAESELKERVEELERFYDMAVGRELRMKELKHEIEQLKQELSMCGKAH